MIRFIYPPELIALVGGLLLFAYAMDWVERFRE